jgi:hypothetical protein
VLFQKYELVVLCDDKISNYTDHPVLLEHSVKKQVTLGIAGVLDFVHCLVLQTEQCFHYQVKGCAGAYSSGSLKKRKSQSLLDQTEWYTSNTLDLCLGSVQFESWPELRIS